MSQIDFIPSAQRVVLDRLKAGKGLTPRQRVSAKALVSAGFLDTTDNGWALNKVGNALYEEDSLRTQSTRQFSVGEPVEHSCWLRSNGRIDHEWRPATVRSVGGSFLRLKFDDGHEEMRYPRNVRKAGQRQEQR